MKRLICICCVLIFAADAYPQPTRTVQLVLGAPRKVTTRKTFKSITSSHNDLLVSHSGYVLSYNQSRGAANWVTWHLSGSDIGPIIRRDPFAPDPLLPKRWQIVYDDYKNNGLDLDRGHMCPSEDRTDTQPNNDETFLMSNMQPQVGGFNGGIWKSLEGFAQKKAKDEGLEAYITAGCYGSRGRIKDKITIPTQCWKIILLLPEGNNDLRRINCATRVIAVDMPNQSQAGTGRRWTDFRFSVDEIERRTGFDFLNTLSPSLQKCLERKIDNQ